MVPDWLLKTPVFESPLLDRPKTRIVRREWIERARVNGRTTYRFDHSLRKHGSRTETVQEPATAFVIGPVVVGPPGSLGVITS